MTGERPEDARGPEDGAGPADGSDDGREARDASAPDAPFRGLRSAADIFGAPRGADEWPSRRERREAERAARETGAPLPEPFEPVADEAAAAPAADDGAAAGVGVAPVAPGASDPEDAGATQAIPMSDELREASLNPQAAAEHERETLGERIPPAAPVPPSTTASHPSSISLPTAMHSRDQRAAENRAVDEERRRLDPFGQGRTDVDWLGRATGPGPAAPTPTPTGPVAQPIGVGNVLPPTTAAPTNEPPSFTELLRLQGEDDPAAAGGTDRPFDWAVRDDDAGEVPTALTTDRFDTTALGVAAGGAAAAGVGSWSLSAEADPEDEVVPGETADAADAADAAARTSESPSPAESDPVTPAPVAAAATPWWAEPATAAVPPTAAPPSVEPTAAGATAAGATAAGATAGPVAERPAAERLPAAAPEDLDQSEWDGRETSDTSAIKDLFGTEAVGQLGETGYDPHDSGTRMMPAVGADQQRDPAVARAAGPDGASTGSTPGPDRDNFINEGFGRLRNEGKRGKQLLVVAAVVLIVVLLVAVFGLTRWILGSSISEERAAAPNATSAASAPAESMTPSPTQEAAAPSAPPQTLQFATTPATPGEHAWTDLAGGECLSPFTDAWAQTFTVVDCSAAHAAQLTARVQVEAGQWPGPEALAAQASQVCQSSQAIDTAAAAGFGDVQVQGSYAPDQSTWDRGNTFISCFATRSSGQPLTGSLAPTGT